MATTFVVEDGTGLATANAYLEVADADQYHENYGNPTSWSAAATADKQEAIRIATRYLDGAYSRRWAGYRGEKDQALDWPRRSAIDSDGWTRDSDSVPQEVKDACAVMALRVIDGESLLPDVSAADREVVQESATVGPISESKTYLSTKGNYKRFSIVDAVLRPLLKRQGERIRA